MSKSVQKMNGLIGFRNIYCYKYHVCLTDAAHHSNLKMGCFYCKNKNNKGYVMDRKEVFGLLRLAQCAWRDVGSIRTNTIGLDKLIDNIE